jgi:hypothetical protein
LCHSFDSTDSDQSSFLHHLSGILGFCPPFPVAPLHPCCVSLSAAARFKRSGILIPPDPDILATPSRSYCRKYQRASSFLLPWFRPNQSPWAFVRHRQIVPRDLLIASIFNFRLAEPSNLNLISSEPSSSVFHVHFHAKAVAISHRISEMQFCQSQCS